MSKKLQALLVRQQRLIEESEQQRKTISAAMDLFKKPISWLDRGLSVLQAVRNNRIVLYGAFALLATYKPASARKILLASMSTIKVANHIRDLVRPK